MTYDAVEFLTGLFTGQVKDDSIGPDDLPGDLRCWFEERAAIMEYDGGLPREQAEAMALAETIRLMQNN